MFTDPYLGHMLGVCRGIMRLQGGDLRNALWRELNNGTHEFDWYHKGKDVALAVARGLNFLHNNNVVHR